MGLPPDLPWVRFWAHRNNVYAETDGFLIAGTGRLYDRLPGYPTPTAELPDVPVLGLLGKSGMGKTHEIRKSIDEHQTRDEAKPKLIDLAIIDNSSTLVKTIDDVLDCASSENRVTLVLDSLDECRIEISAAADLIAQAIFEKPNAHEHLRLIICCRDTQWPTTLENRLREIWPQPDDVQIWSLCALTIEDVHTACTALSIDPDAFSKRIQERNLEAFACRPKTLGHLLSSFQESGTLPENRWELYDKGLSILCEEPREREERGHGGELSSGQRIYIASCVAAIGSLTNRALLRLPGADSVVSDDAVSIDDVLGPGNGELAQMTLRRHLDDVLRTSGLFVKADDDHVRFAHRSDAEFLCAAFLIHRGLNTKQLLPLLTSPRDGKLVPQLAGVASFLADKSSEVQDWLIGQSPHMALSAERTLDERQRRRLLDQLMKLADEWSDLYELEDHQLGRIAFPGIGEHLRSVITLDEEHIHQRILALRVISACELGQDVLEDLIDILNDPDDSLWVRKVVADILSKIAALGEERAAKALRPYVLECREDDPEDELKGAALSALWSRWLSADELFENLTPRKKDNLLGSYWSFQHELTKNLHPELLGPALRWVASLGRAGTREALERRRLADEIMQLAWQHLDDEDVLQVFAEAVKASWLRHEDLFNRTQADDLPDLLNDDKKRRSLLASLLSSDLDEESLNEMPWGLMRDGDIEFLISQLAEPQSINPEKTAKLIRARLSMEGEQEVLEYVRRHADPDSDECIPILSEVAWSYLQETRPKNRAPNRATLSEPEDLQVPDELPRSEHITNAIDKCRSESTDGWIRLVWALASNLHSFTDAIGVSLVNSPGWKQLNAEAQERIASFAVHYLKGMQPSETFLTETSRFTVGDAGAWAALDYLFLDAPEEDLEPEVIERWRPFLLRHTSLQKEEERRPKLLRSLYEHDPSGYCKELETLIRTESESSDHGFNRAWEFGQVWASDIAEVFRSLAFDFRLNPKSREALARELLRHQDEECLEELKARCVRAGTEREKVFNGALLLTEAPSRSWDVLEPLLEETEETVKVLLGKAVWYMERDSVGLPELQEWQCAALYSVLERIYPQQLDRELGWGDSTVTTQDRAADVRRRLLGRLRTWGSDDAVAALRDLVDRFPEQPWLRRYLSEGEQEARIKGWTAPEPDMVWQIIEDSRRRMVRDARELADVVLESLEALQQRLQRETPMAPFLWTRNRDGEIVHVSEDRISDFVKDHLRENLEGRNIVIQREVQVRNLKDIGIGERTDLMIDAISEQHGDVCSVVVEVKGDWHTEILTSIEQQLAGRYLIIEPYRVGFYLAIWTGTRQEKFGSKGDLLERLAETAEQLCTGGRTVIPFVLDISLDQKSSP